MIGQTPNAAKFHRIRLNNVGLIREKHYKFFYTLHYFGARGDLTGQSSSFSALVYSKVLGYQCAKIRRLLTSCLYEISALPNFVDFRRKRDRQTDKKVNVMYSHTCGENWSVKPRYRANTKLKKQTLQLVTKWVSLIKWVTLWLSAFSNNFLRKQIVKYFARMSRKLAHSINTIVFHCQWKSTGFTCWRIVARQ